MADRTSGCDIALSVFARIEAEFPGLAIVIDDDPDDTTDCSLHIDSQLALSFELWANLQNDELYLEVGAFRYSWFPCTEPARVEAFYAAIQGLLTGEYRIVEKCRGRRTVEADLQCPTSKGWSSLATWAVLWSFPWPRVHEVVVRNTVAA